MGIRGVLRRAWLCVPLMVGSAWAAPFQVQRITGTVVDVSRGTLVVRAGEKQYRFELSDPALRPVGEVTPGDKVTVWFSMDARGLKVHSRARVRQEAGQAGKKKRDSSESPAKEPRLLIDDRAFYPARNEEEDPDQQRKSRLKEG